MNQARVCVVGPLSIDTTATVKRLPKPGETVDGISAIRAPGGKGATQAVAAARAGAEVSIIGRVGRDEEGVLLRSTLRREPIHTVGLADSWNEPTGTCYITVGERGQSTSVVVAGANAQLEPGDIDEAREQIEKAAVVLITFEIQQATVLRAAQIARASGVRVVLNAAPARPIDPALGAMVDLLVINHHEARIIADYTGTSDEELEARLAKLGPPAVLMTLGAAGSVLLLNGERHHIPVWGVAAIDTSGAGDIGIGAIAAEWARESGEPDSKAPAMERLPDAARFAAAAGSIAVTRRGGRASAPPPGAIEEMGAQAV
ncbi:MAG: ribokinase [Phycisphaerales bacterium]|jgi:ribokinase